MTKTIPILLLFSLSNFTLNARASSDLPDQNPTKEKVEKVETTPELSSNNDSEIPSLEVLMYLGEFTDSKGYIVDPRRLKIITRINPENLSKNKTIKENTPCLNNNTPPKDLPYQRHGQDHKTEPGLDSQATHIEETDCDVPNDLNDKPASSASAASLNEVIIQNEVSKGDEK